ncbi:hypothetical protein [Haliangium sp.]|uniref:hypothetical protein n=1 Tax=Haliangium sp. TaxID=2663208 RepID=UPI003D0D1F54
MSETGNPPTLDELVVCVHRHYPRGVEADDPRHQDSEESHRLVCVQEAAAMSCQWNFYDVPTEWRVPLDPCVLPVITALRAWRPLHVRWCAEIPAMELWDESNPWLSACYRYSAVRPNYAPEADEWYDPVTCVVSILAPVYALYTCSNAPGEHKRARYSAFPDRYQERLAALSRLVEEMLGFHRLEEEVLLHPVLDVVPGSSNLLLGEATMRDCLFSSRVRA